ncbi:hypothetical protein LEP1GSC108_4241 [Leptospira weilii str. UI 13098]|uniref:Uncharacterized protein n=1 Tax=Leptospira weilii str. UI 13098 TaxID=1088542 RepID=M6QQH2_9LEPT|nr:hypothetical protein LEP1GSC108_4241 [Leptospira weilii str. UI 13098]
MFRPVGRNIEFLIRPNFQPPNSRYLRIPRIVPFEFSF